MNEQPDFGLDRLDLEIARRIDPACLPLGSEIIAALETLTRARLTMATDSPQNVRVGSAHGDAAPGRVAAEAESAADGSDQRSGRSSLSRSIG
jgi:hypothetical protein